MKSVANSTCSQLVWRVLWFFFLIFLSTPGQFNLKIIRFWSNVNTHFPRLLFILRRRRTLRRRPSLDGMFLFRPAVMKCRKHKSDKTPAPAFPAALHRPSIWRPVPPPRSPWPPPPVGTTPHCPSTSSARPWEATPPCRPPSACCITSERTATRSPTSFTPTQPCKGLGAWQVEVKAISLLLFECARLSRHVKTFAARCFISWFLICFALFFFCGFSVPRLLQTPFLFYCDSFSPTISSDWWVLLRAFFNFCGC